MPNINLFPTNSLTMCNSTVVSISNLIVGNNLRSSLTDKYKFLLKFDFSNLCSISVNKAYLYLYLSQLNTNDISNKININIGKIDNEFLKSPYANSLQISNLNLTFHVSKINTHSYIKIDITNLVSNWISNSLFNFGIAFYSDYFSNFICEFSCSDNPPYIDLNYDMNYTFDYNLYKSCPIRCTEGITGPTGPQGEIGPTGPQGEIGPQGPIGIQGPVGPTGPQGEIGPQGNIGPQGSIGIQGPVGPTGPQGEIGPQGPIGIQGPIGPTGPQGEIGPTGATGPTASLSNSYAYFYDPFRTRLIANTGVPLVYSNGNLLSITLFSEDTLLFLESGVYVVDCYFIFYNISSNQSLSLALFVDGVQSPGTTLYISPSNISSSASVILSMSANQTLSLVSFNDIDSVELPPLGDRISSITIYKIADLPTS